MPAKRRGFASSSLLPKAVVGESHPPDEPLLPYALPKKVRPAGAGKRLPDLAQRRNPCCPFVPFRLSAADVTRQQDACEQAKGRFRTAFRQCIDVPNKAAVPALIDALDEYREQHEALIRMQRYLLRQEEAQG